MRMCVKVVGRGGEDCAYKRADGGWWRGKGAAGWFSTGTFSCIYSYRHAYVGVMQKKVVLSG